jgi:hypothetical protein
VTEEELRELRNNQWVATAKYLAPSNLVLRQWGLIDLFSGTPAHAAKILILMGALTYDPPGDEEAGGGRLWAEGYSYWMYTREVIALWADIFREEEAGMRVRAILAAVDSCFAVTAYDRNGVWYPVPFGDLRNDPLLEPARSLRDAMSRPEPGSCAFVTVAPLADGQEYVVAAKPVGLNTHVPIDTLRVQVRNGMPAEFEFYEGYDKKYPDPAGELEDILHPERVGSVNRLGLKERFKE